MGKLFGQGLTIPDTQVDLGGEQSVFRTPELATQAAGNTLPGSNREAATAALIGGDLMDPSVYSPGQGGFGEPATISTPSFNKAAFEGESLGMPRQGAPLTKGGFLLRMLMGGLRGAAAGLGGYQPPGSRGLGAGIAAGARAASEDLRYRQGEYQQQQQMEAARKQREFENKRQSAADARATEEAQRSKELFPLQKQDLQARAQRGEYINTPGGLIHVKPDGTREIVPGTARAKDQFDNIVDVAMAAAKGDKTAQAALDRLKPPREGGSGDALKLFQLLSLAEKKAAALIRVDEQRAKSLAEPAISDDPERVAAVNKQYDQAEKRINEEYDKLLGAGDKKGRLLSGGADPDDAAARKHGALNQSGAGVPENKKRQRSKRTQTASPTLPRRFSFPVPPEAGSAPLVFPGLAQ